MEVVARVFRNLRFAVALGLLLASPAGALTLSEVRTESRTLSLDSGSVRKRFSDARVNALINEGQRQMVVEARPLVKSLDVALVVGTTYYSLPADFFQISRVTLEYDVLSEVTPEALDKQDRWETVGQRPTHYFIDFATRTKVGFYPYPESVSSTGTVRVEYFAQATDLSSDSSEPFNGVTELDPYHYGLAYFAAAHMSAIDGKNGLATFYVQMYQAALNRMKSEAKSRPSYRPGAVGRRE